MDHVRLVDMYDEAFDLSIFSRGRPILAISSWVGRVSRLASIAAAHHGLKWPRMDKTNTRMGSVCESKVSVLSCGPEPQPGVHRTHWSTSSWSYLLWTQRPELLGRPQ